MTCAGYITVADIQAEYGADVADLSAGQIQRRIDRLVAQLEDNLGRTFGRALVITSTAAETVAVDADSLTVGGDDYPFATYSTLGALVAAINAANDTYEAELVPVVNPGTPATLLATQTAVACGPAYENRAQLCLTALWLQLTGDGQSHLFLPLPLRSVGQVTENGVEVTATYYWAVAGESWLVRKACDCIATSECYHPRGRWSARYPGNLQVSFVPAVWGRAPGPVKDALIRAFGLDANLGNLEAESFGEYSYKRRSGGPLPTVQQVLGDGSLRKYAVSFVP